MPDTSTTGADPAAPLAEPDFARQQLAAADALIAEAGVRRGKISRWSKAGILDEWQLAALGGLDERLGREIARTLDADGADRLHRAEAANIGLTASSGQSARTALAAARYWLARSEARP